MKTIEYQPHVIEIVGSRLRLRTFVVEDSRQIFDLIDRNRSHLSQFGDGTAREYESVAKVESSIVFSKPNRSMYGIWNENSKLVGSINIELDPHEPKKGELEYYLGKEFTGHGYATKAVNLLTSYAFLDMGLSNVVAFVLAENTLSQKVLERAKYQLRGCVVEGNENVLLYERDFNQNN